MIFILFSSAYHSLSTRRGEPLLCGQLPALLRAKISVALSLSNACFLQIISLRTTHNVPN